MRKRLSTLAVAVLAALVASTAIAADASAAYQPGNYKGSTKQDYRFKFKAKALGVKRFKLKIEAPCEDGTVQLFEATGAEAPTDSAGKFVAAFVGDTTTVTVTGRLKGKRAKGKIVADGFNVDGSACSATTKWNAKKK